MRFWDSSALVPIFAEQPARAALLELLRADPGVAVWALSDVELRAAFARLEREGRISAAAAQSAAGRIEVFLGAAFMISFLDAVKARALRVLGLHPLRAADALQLAAALVHCSDHPAGVEFVCLDARLSDAARREGFTVLPEVARVPPARR